MIGTMTVKEAEAIEKAVTRSINDYNKNCIEYKIIDLLSDTSSSSSVLINLNTDVFKDFRSRHELEYLKEDHSYSVSLIFKSIANITFSMPTYKDNSCHLFIICDYDNTRLTMEVKGEYYKKKSYIVKAFKAKKGGEVQTNEGTMNFSADDYIIEGIEGEFYPCKPSIFEKTYRPLNKFETWFYKKFILKEKKENKK